MPQPVALSVTTPPRNFPERIVIDETERAEQFAAFLRARVGEDSPAPGRAAERSQALPPPARFDWNPPKGAASPPGASPSGDATAPESSDSSSASFAAPFTETEPVFQPNTPRYQDVPDVWKWPIGPYQQAPEEFGGEWWKVNPFTPHFQFDV